MTKVFLKKDTVVNGNVTSETLTVGEQLIVDGNDITIKIPIKGVMKDFKMSKVIEAIMALNERTCMMYPDHEFIKAEDAYPTHDNDDDGLPDLTSGLTFEVTDDTGETYSVVLSETSIVRSLKRGNILTSDEINTLIDAFNHSDIRPSNRTFISPVIYDNGDTDKVGLKSFQLEDYSTAVLPATDGLYNYNVTEWNKMLQIKIEGNLDSYRDTFIKAFVTGMANDNKTLLIYPIPPLLDGIIYDKKEFKRLNNVIEDNYDEFNGIVLNKMFDIKREGAWESISGAIMNINHWPVDDIEIIDGYFVRAPESIISEVVCDDKLREFHSQYEILERPVYTVCIYNNSGEPITIAENIALDTDYYGFKENESLSPENMEKIYTNLLQSITGSILIGNVIYDYDHATNTITLVAATNNSMATVAERGSNDIVFMDTRLTGYNDLPLYTYTVTDTKITVNRNEDIENIDAYALDTRNEAISLISPITNAIIVTQDNTPALSTSLVLDGLFEDMTVGNGITTVSISHWKFGTECSVKDMFANWKDADGNTVFAECDVEFVNASISKPANKLSIELTVRETGEGGDATYKTTTITDIEPVSDGAEWDTQFTLTDIISDNAIEACKSAVINYLISLNSDWSGTAKYVCMETIPYVITDGVAYIRGFIVKTNAATVYIEPYNYVLNELGQDSLTMTVSVTDKSSYESVQTPPLKNPICTLCSDTETAQGLVINYTNLAQGSGLNGEVDISHWSLRNVKSLDGAFSGCNSMTKLICEHHDTDWIGSCDMNGLCSACTSLESVVLDSLPFGIKSIDNAFAGCEKLQNVLISGVSLNTISFDGLFNGCSCNSGVDVQIYNNEPQRVVSFIDTFTNVLSMNIKTNNEYLSYDIQNIGWYFDDTTNNKHGFNTCKYKSEQYIISPFTSCTRDTSIASLMEYSEDMTYISSTSIGPDVDYTGSNVQSIETITLVDAINNKSTTIPLTTGLSYTDDILALTDNYQIALKNVGLSDGVIIETLPDHYQTVLNNSNTITLRYCVPGDAITDDESPPYIIIDADQVAFDYSKIGNGNFNPPFRRPMLINSDDIETITLISPDIINTYAIRGAQPIYNRIVDYTHWDTKTYLTKSVIENIFGSDEHNSALPHIIIAPYISDPMIECIMTIIERMSNFTEITLYTYNDINNSATSNGETDGSTNNYAEVTTFPTKINGMPGYLIKSTAFSQ